MEAVASRQIPIDQLFDCAMAQKTARQFACGLGFGEQASEEIVLVVAELASNLVKHAGCGALTLRPLNNGERIGIEVETEDHGPGMRDVEEAFKDGYSTGGGLGYGLGTVNRLMDELEVSSTAALGTRILCRRWLRVEADMATVHGWQVGVATRPRRLAAANGDAFVIHEWSGHLLAGVIDGLGHGEPAQEAALAAQAYVQSHYDSGLDKLFCGVSRACRGTRGVVMALARFESPTAMTLASLGNIEMRPWTGAKRLQITVQRGFLGVHEDHVRVQQHGWDPSWMLVLHSDGLRTHWQWTDFPGLEREPPQAVANKLLSVLAKKDDDATILAVKNWSAEP
jgi:anti-sigma regulatory factor (Ser/Thr protein kinase)